MSQPNHHHPNITPQPNQLLDFGSLDSATLPDLSLNSLHQPRLFLELGPTDLSISLPHVSNTVSTQSPSNQTQPSSTHKPSDPPLQYPHKLDYDIARHPTKRWTSFSELGRSVLRLKSFEHSTIHGSSPYLRPRLANIKPTSIYSTTSASTHRHLFKLFHSENPLNTPSEDASNASCFPPPILPPMSELLHATTSLDKEFSLIADQSALLEDSPVASVPATDVKNQSSSLTRTPSEVQSPSPVPLVQSQSQRAQSIVSSQSDPIIPSTPPPPLSQNSHSATLTNQPDTPIENSSASVEQSQCPSPTAVLLLEASPMEAIGSDIVSKLPIIHEPLKADEGKVDQPDQDEITNQGPLLDISNLSDDSKPNEDPTSKLLNQPPITPNTTHASQNDRITSGIFRSKKKISDSSSFFKLLFTKGLGHLKPGHSSSVHNNDAKNSV